MSILVSHGPNNDIMWPTFVFNAPGQSNLAHKEVRLVLGYFGTETPLVNLSLLVGTQAAFANHGPFVATAYPYVNCTAFPAVWVGSVTSIPPNPEIKVVGSTMALQIGAPNGDVAANGVQVVMSVPFATQARKYPLPPENLAL